MTSEKVWLRGSNVKELVARRRYGSERAAARALQARDGRRDEESWRTLLKRIQEREWAEVPAEDFETIVEELGGDPDDLRDELLWAFGEAASGARPAALADVAGFVPVWRDPAVALRRRRGLEMRGLRFDDGIELRPYTRRRLREALARQLPVAAQAECQILVDPSTDDLEPVLRLNDFLTTPSRWFAASDRADGREAVLDLHARLNLLGLLGMLAHRTAWAHVNLGPHADVSKSLAAQLLVLRGMCQIVLDERVDRLVIETSLGGGE